MPNFILVSVPSSLPILRHHFLRSQLHRNRFLIGNTTHFFSFSTRDKSLTDDIHERTKNKTKRDATNFKIWEFRSQSTTKGKKRVYTVNANEWTTTWIPINNTKDDHREEDGAQIPSITPKRRVEHYIQSTIHHFLPAGYPQTVASGYARFASYHFIASVSGSAAMVLSTQALLHAIGLGNSAIPVSAALNWVIKDGVGQLGGVLFASHLGHSRGFDTNPKKWRVVSAITMDLATLLEILSPLFPGYFLPIASIANVGKNIGFLSASASRAALHQSLSLSGNLADVTAKSGSQSIAASFVGTALGICMSPLIGNDFANVAMGFLALSTVHQGCTYLALRNVSLKSLDRHRMHHVLRRFILEFVCSRNVDYQHDVEGNDSKFSSIDNDLKKAERKTNVQEHHEKLDPPMIPSPGDIADVEFFLPFMFPDDSHHWLKIGSKLQKFCPDPDIFQQLRECLDPNEKYVVNIHGLTSTPDSKLENTQNQKHKIHLVFLEGATGIDLIRGMFHAYIIRAYFEGTLDLELDGTQTQRVNVISASYDIMLKNIGLLTEGLKSKGWLTDTDYVAVDCSGYRLKVEEG